MSLCIVAAGTITKLAVAAFTLSWTHSVERTIWQEEWLVTDERLVIASASVGGSGAGMEPPPDATSGPTGWRYKPRLPPQRRLTLADSGAADSWWLCSEEGCMELGGKGDGPITIEPCR